ncbi:99_t:CDS:2 [Ambispora leptoticha]|uniref:99_t:CDS:1 n=1 Tax=Ambispora leptoticha TaxID=144679 RepID=A0A9N8ZTH0_9GLOM|nr:99_t:CDS:2 [Ambispora leptoticha]
MTTTPEVVVIPSDDEDDSNNNFYTRPSNYERVTNNSNNSFGGISYENLHFLGGPTGQVPIADETSSSLRSSSSIIFGDATSSNPRDNLFLHPAPTTVINLSVPGSQPTRAVINLDQEGTSIRGDDFSNGLTINGNSDSRSSRHHQHTSAFHPYQTVIEFTIPRSKSNNNKPPPEGHVNDLTETSIVICSECDEPLM